MGTCEICGSVEFETYAGFMYCVVCQTQSQEYHEQEYEYQAADTSRRQKTGSRSKKNKVAPDDGVWTSWEAFNYILYGMTEELKVAFSLPTEFQQLVLKLWASYLSTCNVGFISFQKEAMPKLQYNFKQRDARVMYNIDMDVFSSKKSQRSKSVNSLTSTSSVTADSKRHLAKKRSKIIKQEYKEHLQSATSASSLHDETLESLGRSDPSDFSADDWDCSSDESAMKCFRELFNKKDYETYKSALKSNKIRLSAKDCAKKSIKNLAKNKLLSIIHVALMILGSQVQLSDLLRLIREGHLSYAKVTHFLPKDYKFSKNDYTYIDVISDMLMPTHLSQKKISRQMANFLRIERIRPPILTSLTERYGQDLNLPDQIIKLAQVVVKKLTPDYFIPKSKHKFPSSEALAMVSIIFVMKLLFGLNDKTEYFLSDLASHCNSASKEDTDSPQLFVFEDWQKFLECRKTVLVEYHYPTHEQINSDAFTSSKKFLHMLLKESKDEYRDQRFIPYNKYYMENNLVEAVKDMLKHLTEPIDVDSIEFQPSLTPQSSYLKTIISNLRISAETDPQKATDSVPEEILTQSFSQTSIDLVYDPEKYLTTLRENTCEEPPKLRFYLEAYLNSSQESQSSSFMLDKSSTNLLLNCSSRYWTLHPSDTKSKNLVNFNEEILEKTPESFQWLMMECARMLEMNVRDLYLELVTLECTFAND